MPCISYDLWANHFMLTSVACTFAYMAMAGITLVMILSGLLLSDIDTTDAIYSSIGCLCTLPMTLAFSWIIKRMLPRGSQHLEFLAQQYRIEDFKRGIESGWIWDLDSALCGLQKR